MSSVSALSGDGNFHNGNVKQAEDPVGDAVAAAPQPYDAAPAPGMQDVELQDAKNDVPGVTVENKEENGINNLNLTRQEYIRLKVKTCLFFMIPGLAFALQYLDKSCTGSASVMGFRHDLDMTGNRFSWVNSSYFIAYIVATIPFSLLLVQKVGTRWNGAVLTVWGILVACSAACHNYPSYIAIRVLLGIFESVSQPVITIVASQWARPKDQFAWILTWFAWNGAAQVFLNAIGYGLYTGQLKHEYAIAGWRILFIILGLMSFVMGITFFFLVPNAPQEAIFLTDREKQVMRIKQRANDNRPFTRKDIVWRQVWEPFTYTLHHTIFLFLALICNSLNGGAINTFINLLIKRFVIQDDGSLTDEEANKRSLLYGMIPGAIKCVGCTIVIILSLNGVFRNYRFFYIITFSALHVAAACMLTWGPNANTSLAGVYMYNFSVEVAHAGIISMIATNVGGLTKKTVVQGITLIGFCVGNIVGPQIFRASQLKAGWPSGRRALAGLSAASFVALIALFVSYIIENWRRNKKDEQNPPGTDTVDLTDVENPEFRYHL